MCGIVGFTGTRAAAPLLLEGLKRLEYRGYDSAGIAVMGETLERLGIWYTGGKNAPYIWMACPERFTSWEFFDTLLREVQVVGTPGEGFGKCGEGYFRFSAFGNSADTAEAMHRMEVLLG